ncbi:MAG: hypothetical protein IKM39_01890 [Clostridia bacterium]|nr:hypothetical protein [Clostridia bacterium]
MQLWVSKLNKNKWKIALIILSVAMVTSCIFGVTTAWFNSVDRAKANVSMDVKYIDIFANGADQDHVMIPGQNYTITAPTVAVKETKGTYCVFLQISEIGGAKDCRYLEYSLATQSNWIPLTDEKISEKQYRFPVGREDTKYYYQIVDAANVTTLEVLDSTVTVDLNTTYEQIKAAQEGNGTPVQLSVVAAGCKTNATGTELPSAEEVAFAEVYTAFL